MPASNRVMSWRPPGSGIGLSNGRFQPRSATVPRRADVGAAMIAHGAKHPGLQISKGHVVGKAAGVDLSVMVTVRIACSRRARGFAGGSAYSRAHGLVVEQKVWDRPGHPEN